MLLWSIILSLLLGELVQVHILLCKGEVVFITPTPPPNPDCPDGLPCQTLQQYFSNSSFTESNIDLIMIFLVGQHVGVCNRTVLKASSFTVMGIGPGVIVTCTHVDIRCATLVYFERVTLDHWYISSLRSPVLSLVFQMSAVMAQNHTLIYIEHQSNQSGNIISLNNCVFRSSSLSGRLYFINNTGSLGGLTLASSTVNIGKHTNISFINNSVESCAMTSFLSNLNIESDAIITSVNNYNDSTSLGYFGGALCLLSSTLNIESNVYMTFINNSQNLGGAIFMSVSTMVIGNNSNIIFANNIAWTGGGAVNLYWSELIIGANSSFVFLDNLATTGGAILGLFSVVTIGADTHFACMNNSALDLGGGVLIMTSTMTIGNDSSLIFTGNMGKRGGAIAVVSSIVHIVTNANMTFLINSAQIVGGAMYFDPDLLQQQYYQDIGSQCLYRQQPAYFPNGTSYKPRTTYLWFINNSAALAGDDLYGASLYFCHLRGYNVHYVVTNSGRSSISGNPMRVCICLQQRPQCNVTAMELYIFPGETFTVPAVVVGGDWGPTPGTVYASLRQTSADIQPSSQKFSQINTTQCTALTYNVFSNDSVQLVLSAHYYHSRYYYRECDGNGTDLCKFYSPINLKLYFLPCPPGFSLQGDPPGCDCYPVLTENRVKCDIINGHATFSWNSTPWINASSKGIVYTNNCPFDYCKDIKIIKNGTDIQCAFNRAGRLCGGCKENYSLAIGSSHCIYCPNSNNLTLLIFFAAAGLLLVLFISVLNLTVTQGMIDGPIFYANIVWAYQSILFPKQMQSELIFFKTFIAWLNLDFGIETCLFNGLSAFWKSWLQFVFPFYIWSIAGLMIIAARHSTRLTYLFGNRAVPILATLILLSYTKLLRIVVVVFDFSILTVYLEQSNISTIVVWSVDGTLDYFGYRHVLLFTAGMLSLLFLWLPYTLYLLLIQWVRRISHLRSLKWTMRFYPFYDAYLAPLKPKHQYWFGVLLLARGVILVTFASAFEISQPINLLILLVFAGALLFYMLLVRIYKSQRILAFHSFCFLNLSLLSGFITFTHTQGNTDPTTQATVVGLSIGFVFIQFCCIILHRVYALCFLHRQNTYSVQTRVSEQQGHAILERSTQPENIWAENKPLLQLTNSDDDLQTY